MQPNKLQTRLWLLFTKFQDCWKVRQLGSQRLSWKIILIMKNLQSCRTQSSFAGRLLSPGEKMPPVSEPGNECSSTAVFTPRMWFRLIWWANTTLYSSYPLCLWSRSWRALNRPGWCPTVTRLNFSPSTGRFVSLWPIFSNPCPGYDSRNWSAGSILP